MGMVWKTLTFSWGELQNTEESESWEFVDGKCGFKDGRTSGETLWIPCISLN